MSVSNTMTSMTRLMLLLFCALALVACCTTKPAAYSELGSASLLIANQHDDTGRIPYSYNRPVDWSKFSAFILEPVVIYRGPDHQFGALPETDKATLASRMQNQLSQKLASHFTLDNTVTPHILRAHITLTGAVTNTPVLGTLSRFDPAGGIHNGVQTARDRERTLIGSLVYSIEIYRAQDNRPRQVFFTKRYPCPWNLSASMDALAAPKAGIEKGADALLAQLK